MEFLYSAQTKENKNYFKDLIDYIKSNEKNYQILTKE